jgi:hypothetical protein
MLNKEFLKAAVLIVLAVVTGMSAILALFASFGYVALLFLYPIKAVVGCLGYMTLAAILGIVSAALSKWATEAIGSW